MKKKQYFDKQSYTTVDNKTQKHANLFSFNNPKKYTFATFVDYFYK